VFVNGVYGCMFSAPCGLDTSVRFMCHPSIPLRTHMDFTKPVEEMTPLELSIHKACAPSTDGVCIGRALDGKDVKASESDGNIIDITSTSTPVVSADGKEEEMEQGLGIVKCSCSFHASGGNLQSLLVQITPDRCQDLDCIKRKRRIAELQMLSGEQEGGDDEEGQGDDDSECDGNGAGGVNSEEGDGSYCVNSGGRVTSSTVAAATSSSSSIADMMGFKGFGSSRKSIY
jgi:hypothetical protein